VDGDPLAAVLVSGPSNGTLTLNADGSFTYTPTANFDGTVSFSYRVTDGSALSGVVVVTIDVDAAFIPPPDNEPPPDDDGDSDTQDDPLPLSTVTPAPNSKPPSGGPPRSDSTPERRVEQAIQLVVAPAPALGELSSVEDFVFFDIIDDSFLQDLPEAMQVIRDNAPDLAFVDPQLFWEKLDDFKQGLNADDQNLKLAVGTVALGSLALTATYVFWTVKGGYLLAGVLSQLPAWQFMDPLPIYDAVAGGYWKDDNVNDDDKDAK
jgi:hypothetical protein